MGERGLMYDGDNNCVERDLYRMLGQCAEAIEHGYMPVILPISHPVTGDRALLVDANVAVLPHQTPLIVTPDRMVRMGLESMKVSRTAARENGVELHG